MVSPGDASGAWPDSKPGMSGFEPRPGDSLTERLYVDLYY